MESETREGIEVALAEEWELTLEEATEAVKKFFDEVRAE
jgi:hypothetical protein